MGLLNLLGIKSHPEVIDIDELIKSGGGKQYKRDYESFIVDNPENKVECSGVGLYDGYSRCCVSG